MPFSNSSEMDVRAVSEIQQAQFYFILPSTVVVVLLYIISGHNLHHTSRNGVFVGKGRGQGKHPLLFFQLFESHDVGNIYAPQAPSD